MKQNQLDFMDVSKLTEPKEFIIAVANLSSEGEQKVVRILTAYLANRATPEDIRILKEALVQAYHE